MGEVGGVSRRLRQAGRHLPWTGDSQRRSPRDYVTRIAGPRGRGDLEYAVSSGERGTPPDHTSSWYAWQGLAVMRSGWGKQASYLMFDVGPLGEVHAHEGKLAVEVAAYGRSLIEDLGIHSYSREAAEIPYYDLFGNTPGHNTVIVDGASQMRLVTGAKTVEEPLGNTWVSTGVCDYLEGEYGNGLGTGPVRGADVVGLRTGAVRGPNRHLRSPPSQRPLREGEEAGGLRGYWVITDRLTGSGEHIYEQLFHFVPTPVAADPASGVVRTASEGMANIAILPAVADGVEVEVVEGRSEPAMQGWYCGDRPQPVPAPCVVYRQRGSAPGLLPDGPVAAAPRGFPPAEGVGRRGARQRLAAGELTGRRRGSSLLFRGLWRGPTNSEISPSTALQRWCASMAGRRRPGR